jgi:hypothetical protein
MKTLRAISPAYRIAALAFGGISIFLFGVDALLFFNKTIGSR